MNKDVGEPHKVAPKYLKRKSGIISVFKAGGMTYGGE
jgi:hypothetical protein